MIDFIDLTGKKQIPFEDDKAKKGKSEKAKAKRQEIDSLARVEEVWHDLLAVLTEAVSDLDEDKLSEESFGSFRAVLQIGMEVTKERRAVLMSQEAVSGGRL